MTVIAKSISQNIQTLLDSKVCFSPCVITDTSIVVENYHRLHRAFPFAVSYYSVKANSAIPVLRALHANKCKFDAASIQEVLKCHELGIASNDIHYGNTIKKRSEIAKAYSLGVRSFAFDSIMELEKIAQVAPGSKVIARLATKGEGAAWPLSEKFGRAENKVFDLLLQAKSLNLIPWGICFHVGSQQKQVTAWRLALQSCAKLRATLKTQGISLTALDIGGGFPCQYSENVPSIEAFGQNIASDLTEFGLHDMDIMLEPGRFIVASAGIIQCQVILVIDDKCHQVPQWVFLDIGVYNGLTESGAINLPIISAKDQSELTPTIIAGPTCDSTDILANKKPFMLPKNLAEGDTLIMLNAGAYTASYSTTGFNGFPALKEYFVGEFTDNETNNITKLDLPVAE